MENRLNEPASICTCGHTNSRHNGACTVNLFRSSTDGSYVAGYTCDCTQFTQKGGK